MSFILEKQNTLQRGFTDKSSPMNTAITSLRLSFFKSQRGRNVVASSVKPGLNTRVIP